MGARLNFSKLNNRFRAGQVPGILIGVLALSFAAGCGGMILNKAQNRALASPEAALLVEPSANVAKFALDAVRPVSSREALASDERQPITGVDVIAARPFSTIGSASSDRARALECLAGAVYYEAGNESVSGKRAVAQVVLNRVSHDSYPNSVCGVVYQGSQRATGCQFTFTCDGSLARSPSRVGWARARFVAEEALSGTVFDRVGLSTHYHAKYVVPYWGASLLKTATIGAHIFYRSPNRGGGPSEFTTQYAGIEPDIQRSVIAAGDRLIEKKNVDSSGAPSPPIPGANDVPEQKARAHDRFALLDYKANTGMLANMHLQAARPLDQALASALGARSDSRLATAPLDKMAVGQ